MNTTSVEPVIGTQEFWQFYDEFCRPEHLEQFIEQGDSDLAPQMRQLMETAHKSKIIYQISRPEQNWERYKAWLTIRNAPIRDMNGRPAIHMRVGDVIVDATQWDRDVFITHIPISEEISGYTLSGKWPEMVGLFMPLFDRETILKCIELRASRDVREINERAEKEANDWNWY